MTTITRHPGETSLTDAQRWTLIALGTATIILGSWSFFIPESFFDDFPIRGAAWVSTLGPFNEHLVRDFGSAEIGLGIAAIGVGWMRSVPGASSVLVGISVFGILHLGYHLDTFAEFSAASATSQAIALSLFVLIPAVLLFAIRRTQRKEMHP